MTFTEPARSLGDYLESMRLRIPVRERDLLMMAAGLYSIAVIVVLFQSLSGWVESPLLEVLGFTALLVSFPVMMEVFRRAWREVRPSLLSRVRERLFADGLLLEQMLEHERRVVAEPEFGASRLLVHLRDQPESGASMIRRLDRMIRHFERVCSNANKCAGLPTDQLPGDMHYAKRVLPRAHYVLIGWFVVATFLALGPGLGIVVSFLAVMMGVAIDPVQTLQSLMLEVTVRRVLVEELRGNCDSLV